MKRRLLNFLTVLSLALMVAACVLWVRSNWCQDEIRVSYYVAQLNSRYEGLRVVYHSYCVSTGPNMVWIDYSRVPDICAEPEGARLTWNTRDRFLHAGNQAALWDRYGIHFGTLDHQGLFSNGFVVFLSSHFGWIVVLFGVGPCGMLFHRHRKVAGLCSRCVYDLRATPGRCPECGAVPKTKTRVETG